MATLLRSDQAFLLQASRPGLWLTAIAFYMLPLGQREVFHSVAFWLGALYVSFPMGLLLYGWNDMSTTTPTVSIPAKAHFCLARAAHLSSCAAYHSASP